MTPNLFTHRRGQITIAADFHFKRDAETVQVMGDLDAAARDAVSQWTFRPAIENGQPVPSTVTVPVDFRVE